MLLVHALLVLALWSTRGPASQGTTADVRALPITVWLPPPASDSAVRAAPPVRSAPRNRQPQVPVTPVAEAPAEPRSTAISLDWQSELTGAARRSVPTHAADEAKGSFSPAPRALAKPCKTPPSAFRFESEKPSTGGKLRGLGQDKEEAYSHLFDDMRAASQPDSSVPPIECPPPR